MLTVQLTGGVFTPRGLLLNTEDALSRTHKKVDSSFLNDEQKVVAREFVLPVPITTVWQSLTGDTTWEEWIDPLSNVMWLLRTPDGVGSRRSVHLFGKPVEETFIAWEEGRRLAFRFDSSSLPVSALAEDYVLKEHERDQTLMRWSVRVDGNLVIRSILSHALAFAIGRQIPAFVDHLKSLHGAEDSSEAQR